MLRERTMHVYSRDGDIYYGNVMFRNIETMTEEEYDKFIKETLEEHFPNLKEKQYCIIWRIIMPKGEFKVGETFQCGLVKLKCVKSENPRDPCRGCFINQLTGNYDCFCFENIVGECTCYDREDETSVIFVKVED